MNSALNTVIATLEGSTLWVRITEDAVHNYEATNVDQIVETLHSTLANEFKTRFETVDEFEARFQGVLLIQSIEHSSKSWAWFNGSAAPLSSLTFREIENGIAEIEQSVDPVSAAESLRRNKYGFLFHREIRGAGKTKPPSYIKKRLLETWQEQEYNGCKINCGAFALVYQQTLSPGSQMARICREAYTLQQIMNWGEYVTVEDLLKYVEYKKDCRLTVIIPTVACYERYTRAGMFYEYIEENGLNSN